MKAFIKYKSLTSASSPSCARETMRERKSVFTCYPNPVHELLNLSLTENITNFYNLNIFDINGKSVFRKTQLIFDSKTPSVVDVSKFPPAIYFIQLTGNEKNYFSYFIKH